MMFTKKSVYKAAKATPQASFPLKIVNKLRKDEKTVEDEKALGQ